ncbi:hypothetical protein EIP86_000686 [Pleurotus ostreatoroseus]|nr:hypothetical protein EIP86_000686 [Pleurotus ostreatoroseus]
MVVDPAVIVPPAFYLMLRHFTILTSKDELTSSTKTDGLIPAVVDSFGDSIAINGHHARCVDVKMMTQDVLAAIEGVEIPVGGRHIRNAGGTSVCNNVTNQ